MKKCLFALSGLMVLGSLVACGGAGEDVEETPADTEEVVGDFDATMARETYEAACIACHGGNLEGGAGPQLTDGAYSYEEIIHAIEHGKGAMPPQNVDQEEAENLAKWIEAQ
ncbi:cytochrome c [Halalkalibacterium halodurans]|jgi:mono/diheme cytochrome c family protein|uniref:c-type cytochrome n=1 Tax=Halalkalibacterium halodurans TaxID=86665 RepID=UPI0010672283|nr:cytochrome c [Halalkalibacterium halodurans]MED3647540.1 cytochrome c [Halalkalibacterium halodurans]MED4081915.1 cytochrome c [Halalkalibacterium halodurans]MED4083704.1 cytochrome c [Halalkalibacterium halodurans]MED4106394.1 cytochrome c [Halalkalibacterium halodurans]MED4107805.1 cytochrome c [Halalkalibacterium halodurans]